MSDNPVITPGDLMTVTEVAEYLRLKPNTVKAWLRDGRLPGTKVGKFWWVRRSDLEALFTHNGNGNCNGDAA